MYAHSKLTVQSWRLPEEDVSVVHIINWPVYSVSVCVCVVCARHRNYNQQPEQSSLKRERERIPLPLLSTLFSFSMSGQLIREPGQTWANLIQQEGKGDDMYTKRRQRHLLSKTVSSFFLSLLSSGRHNDGRRGRFTPPKRRDDGDDVFDDPSSRQ